jgi:chromosome segregation ATPase
MTLEDYLKARKSAFTSKSGEAEAMAKEMSELKASNKSLKDAAAFATKELKAMSAIASERDEAIAKVEELTKALAANEELKKQAVAQIESVGKKSASIAAAVGVSPVEISAADNVSTKNPEEVWSEYLEIKDPAQKVSFYNKNRASIVAHLGIK